MNSNLDIDSSQFECQKYVSHFLKTQSVQDLIKRHNQLQHEIKDYDQEIQSLVFENYSKFISSIDTVKQMKVDITKIDSKMASLEASMNKVASLSRRVDSQLSIKREEIIKLDTVNKDLSKLNNLCNFPQVLQKELDQYRTTRSLNFDDHFNETASYYKQCYQQMDKYKNEPLIQPIYKEVTQKLETIRQILWNALIEFKQQNPLLQLYSESKVSISTQEARSAVKKLICVMEDEEAVLRHYQKIIKERYLTVAKELIDKASISKSSELINLMDYLEDCKYEYSIESLEEYKRMKEKEFVQNDVGVQGSILWLVGQLGSVIFSELRSEVSFQLIEIRGILRDKSLEHLCGQCIREIVQGIFGGVSDKMSQKKINNVQVNEVLVRLQSELQVLLENGGMISKLRSEIMDKFAENVENICRGQVMTSFSQLRVQFLELLVFVKNDLNKAAPQDIKRQIMTLITVVKQKLLAFTTIRLLDLKAFVQSQHQNYLREQDTTYFSLIQASLLEFVKFVANVFAFRPIAISYQQLQLLFNDAYVIQQVIPLLNSGDSPLYYIFGSQFLQLYGRSLHLRLVELLDAVFPSRKTVNENEVARITTLITQSSARNMLLFAQCQSEYWLKHLLVDFEIQTNSGTITEQRALPLINQFMEALGIIFPDTKRNLTRKSSIAQQTSFNIQMEVVMVRKCHSLEKNITERNSLIQTVLKYYLKVLLLRLRTIHLTEQAYQQLQLNLHFIMQLFYDIVSIDDEGLIAGFYFELIDAASKNSTKDIRVDPKILEQLNNQFRS